MGNAPSTCNNRYDGTITSFLVTYPGGTLDPIAHPNSTFTLQGDMTYNVTFTIHTQAQSSNGNALGGTTWYDQNVYGFYDGVCYPSQAGNSVGPNQDVSITMGGITHPCCSGYQVYQIDFATFSQLQQPVAFKINWQPALAPASVTSVTTSTSAATSTVSSSSGSLSSSSPALSQAAPSASSSSQSSTSFSNSSGKTSSLATTVTANQSSGPSLTAADVLAVTGLAVAGAYAFGWAMIRRLK